MIHQPIAAATTTQLDKLDALIVKLTAARSAAITGRFFDSHEGQAAINAAHDLFEVDGLYDLALDVACAVAPEAMVEEVLGITGPRIPLAPVTVLSPTQVAA